MADDIRDEEVVEVEVDPAVEELHKLSDAELDALIAREIDERDDQVDYVKALLAEAARRRNDAIEREAMLQAHYESSTKAGVTINQPRALPNSGRGWMSLVAVVALVATGSWFARAEISVEQHSAQAATQVQSVNVSIAEQLWESGDYWSLSPESQAAVDQVDPSVRLRAEAAFDALGSGR